MADDGRDVGQRCTVYLPVTVRAESTSGLVLVRERRCRCFLELDHGGPHEAVVPQPGGRARRRRFTGAQGRKA